MERQHTRSPCRKPIARAALAGLAIIILFGNLDWTVNQLRYFLWYSAAHRRGVLPSIVLAAGQAMQAYGFDRHRLLECFLRVLLSFLPLLLVMAGAI